MFLRVCLSARVHVIQVATLNPKDNTYSLKDFIYRDVQRDWPGYSEDEKTQVDRILARYRNSRGLGLTPAGCCVKIFGFNFR